MNRSETYLDIVWRQFKKNRAAYWSLWVLGFLFLVAVFAPLLASNQPLIFWDEGEMQFPWWRALFNTTEPVDYIFNMALLGFVPWIVLAVWTEIAARRRQRSNLLRLLYVVGEYLGIVALLAILFWLPDTSGKGQWLRPSNKYGTRTFAEEEFESRGRKAGYYALIPFGPTEQDLDAIYKEPLHRKPSKLWKESNDGFIHLLGTDSTGRDVLVQMIYGTRISMTIGFVAVSIYITIGVILGAIAGYFGGTIDILISRVVEVVLLFPSFFLILTLVGLIGPSIYMIMVVIGLTGWPTTARLIRGEVLKQRAIDYVIAARALGATNLRVIFRHILPNALAPVLVSAPFGIAGAITTEAGLSLLGFGVRPPTPTWGTLLRLGSINYNYWWLVIVPALGIFITVTVFNLVGSGLRDAMDPRLRM